MTITEFLLARITEDEDVAIAAATSYNKAWHYGDEPAGMSWASDGGMVGNDATNLWDCEGSDTLCAAPEVATHMARHDPSRVLAECKAKRALVDIHTLKDAGSGKSIDPDHREVGCETCNWDTSYWWLEYGPCETLKALAAVHADHPDYNQEWKI